MSGPLPSSPPGSSSASSSSSLQSKSRSPPPAWRWRCHKCNSSWPLSIGPRCIECKHVLCFPDPAETAAAAAAAATIEAGAAPGQEKKGSVRPAKQRRKNCRVMFPFDYWRTEGLLRRSRSAPEATNHDEDTAAAGGRSSAEIYPTGPSRAGGSEKRDTTLSGSDWFAGIRQRESLRTEKLKTGQSRCEVDCDWPNECLTARWNAGYYSEKGASNGEK